MKRKDRQNNPGNGLKFMKYSTKRSARRTLTITLALLLCLAPQTVQAASKAPAEKAESLYEAVAPQYRYDDDAAVTIPSTVSSRFTLQDGVYINPDAAESNEATLMITGDLMCQYLQQAAVFQSDGQDYLSYTEVLQIIKDAKEKQQQAAEYADSAAEPASDPAASTGSNTDKDDSSSGDSKDAQPEIPPAASSVALPPLDLGVIPQPTGTFDFAKSFQYVKNIFAQGDLVIGNLETMLSQSSPLGMQIRQLEDKPYLNGPISYLDALTYAGYDLLTMANNHNCDTGVRGILETIENVDSYKFMRTGLFASEDETRYLIVDVNGIKIGFVAYAVYYNQKDNNLTEEGQAVMLNRFSTDQARADIKAAKANGAEYVIAFLHCGTENTNETNSRQEQNARALAKAGADYIVGSHPHALQRYDIIETADDRQVPVIYSMGNFLSNMSRDINSDTIILRLNLARDEKGEVTLASQRYYPCKVIKSLTTTDENGKSQTDSYVLVPEIEKYMPDLNPKNAGDQEVLKQLSGSYDRILKIFGGRMTLPLPYDPYKVEEDDQAGSIFYNLSNRLIYIKESAA